MISKVLQHFTSQYCAVQPGPEELTIDHVLPRSQGGTSTWENCVLSCIDCNKKKADRTPGRPTAVMTEWQEFVKNPLRSP